MNEFLGFYGGFEINIETNQRDYAAVWNKSYLWPEVKGDAVVEDEYLHIAGDKDWKFFTKDFEIFAVK